MDIKYCFVSYNIKVFFYIDILSIQINRLKNRGKNNNKKTSYEKHEIQYINALTSSHLSWSLTLSGS